MQSSSYGAALAAAARVHRHASKPVPWEKIHNKNAYYWKIYSEPRGTDLSKAKPKYHKCHVFPDNQKAVLHQTFEHNSHFEFQQLRHNLIAVNCIDCSEPSLGNVFSNKISEDITCKFYKKTPLK